MALQEINIDFEVLKTGNPETLIVCDTSTWAHIENKKSTIDIYLPTEKVITYSHLKGQNTVFNSSSLLLSKTNVRESLPDGIYKIVLKGSPDNYQKERSVIRTEKLQMDIDAIYSSYGLNINDIPEEIISVVRKANFMLDGADSAMRRDEKKLAVEFYKEARRLVEDHNKCKDC